MKKFELNPSWIKELGDIAIKINFPSQVPLTMSLLTY